MASLYGRIKIELMSDLCVGSGYSHAGVIDADVSYDEYGLPFIPARRLKGCMREAAEMVCPAVAETIFGRAGDTGTKGMILWNAYIEGYDRIAGELVRLEKMAYPEAAYLSPQNILKMYTAVRAQTKLSQDTGVAERNSLRYTRVVGQYDPLQEKTPLCFYAKVEFEDTDREQLERVIKATRNIGMNRNRGLGSVRCSLTDVHEMQAPERMVSEETGEERVCLTYVLRNQESLLMSSDSADTSDSYISGKSILGNLAGAYLSGKERTAEEKRFQDLFLNGDTVFTNAYVTVPPDADRKAATAWPDYCPAPLYINRLKKTKVLVNLLGEEQNACIGDGMEHKYDTGNGNLPKKLKTHYIHEAKPNVFQIVEPKREILYHNSQRELLYTSEAMKKGQYFKGRIYVRKKYANLLKELMETGRLSFGKSRTAQYGNCELAADITMEKSTETAVCARSGEKIAVVMESDAVFLQETDGYTVRFDAVRELVARQLKIPYDRTKDEGSILTTREITGYNTKWNLRRQGIPAVKAGSVLVYTIEDGQSLQLNMDFEQVFVGERNLEGYGQVRIRKCSDMEYAAGMIEERQGGPDEKPDLESCRPFLIRILTGQLLDRLVLRYMKELRDLKEHPELNLTASTIGRLNLMLQESLNTYRHDPGQAFQDFCERIASIKRTKEREEAFRLLSAVMLKEEKKEEKRERKQEEEKERRLYELDIRKMTARRKDEETEQLCGLLEKHVSGEEYEAGIAALWGIYMGNILAYHKYRKKQEGGKEKNEQ